MLVLSKKQFVSLLALIVLLTGTAITHAWTGPSATPPNSNVSAPVNIGTTDQVKNGGLALNALVVFGNALFSGIGTGVGRYLNFDYTTTGTSGTGSTGYGFRDNAGVMEVKDAGGSWARFATTTGTGAFNQVRFSDGTIQTTASTGGRTSCPSGFSLVGTSGSAGAFCISTNEETAATWVNAVTGCSNKNPVAFLCPVSEWALACVKAATYGVNTMTGNYEWLGDTYGSNSAVRAGQTTCASLNADGVTGLHPYRCCFR